MGQTGRRSIATHILAVKIALAAAHFHSAGAALTGLWDSVEKRTPTIRRSLLRRSRTRRIPQWVWEAATLRPGKLLHSAPRALELRDDLPSRAFQELRFPVRSQ